MDPVSDQDGVVAVARDDGVGAGADGDGVVARAAVDEVVAAARGDLVVAVAAKDGVVAVANRDLVVTSLSVDEEVGVSQLDGVGVGRGTAEYRLGRSGARIHRAQVGQVVRGNAYVLCHMHSSLWRECRA